MGDYGFKISIPGVTVTSATTLQLVMSSSFNMLKAKLVGSTTGNQAHGLAYVPAYFAISKISATKAGIVGQNYFTAIPYCNATNFVSGGGGVNTVKYYIFYQKAA